VFHNKSNKMGTKTVIAVGEIQGRKYKSGFKKGGRRQLNHSNTGVQHSYNKLTEEG